MRLLGYIIVFAIVLFCNEVRAQEPGHCKKPDRLKEAELQGVWDTETYPPGKIAIYSCRPGYTRLGAIKYVCAEGTWQILTKGQCRKKSCGHPEDIPFGTFELKEETEFVLGAVVEYSCEDGYQMVSKQKHRECTANGWSNFPPHCEVKKCPPVVVGGGVQLVSSSYDDEYSVGQVIRFECKDAKLTINGNSEIFCTTEGEWSGNPPTCQEISCNLPVIENGRVLVPKQVYKEDEKLSFSCSLKYRKERNLDPVCTNRGWNPQPSCREIVCYPDYVENGKVIQTQNIYREGETIQLKCNDGFTIEHNPDLPRTCTAEGWSPPLTCISKNCDKPQIEHGGLYYYSKYGYPRRINSEIEYWCENGFLSTLKSHYGKSVCTSNGWHPKPKCTVSCSNADAIVDNADISGHQRIYVSGDILHFTCKKGFSTVDGKNSGQIECLPDGKFSKAKCHNFCNMESLKHGHYQPEKGTFEFAEYLQYECDEGFSSPQGKKVDKAQCTTNGWYQEVMCNEIICSVNKNKYVNGDVVIFSCPRGYRLSGSEVSQCYYYGWDPALPICEDINYTYRKGKLSEAKQVDVSDCPPVPEPAYVQRMHPKSVYNNGDTVEMRCDPGFIRHGSNMTTCHNGKWSSPPQCIYSQPCYKPPGIENGGLTKESEKREYAAGDVVKYQCNTGYSISGSAESLCLNGRWQTTPICTGNDCGRAKIIPHATIQDEKANYKHADSVVYVCLPGYKLVGDNPAKCVNGEWKQIPACNSSLCGSPPKVSFGNPVEVKHEYKSGDKVKYECVRGYAFEKHNEALCEDTRWKQIPVCRKIGDSCGPAPVVQYAETLQPKQATYRSDFVIEYICPDYYIVEGNKKIKCSNGVWDEPPVCLEPCTAGEKEMKDNNIKLRWTGAPKLYSKHGEWIGFQCLNGFEIPDEKALRVTCNRGKLNYPRCLKRGSCILSQQAMETNNIYINGSTEIDNGETVKFECYIGMEPENTLTSTCRQGKIDYPKCTNSRSCKLAPEILNGKLKTENKDSFESGSFVDIECNQGFELVGSISVQCNNGQWTEAPQCLESCEISSETLDQNNIELLSPDDVKKKHSHATHINFKCKSGYVLSSPAASLKADCNNGKINYPNCSVGKKCLAVPEVLNGIMKTEVKSSYDTGSLVEFECKQNFVIGGRKKARCNDGQWTDLPRCLEPCEISPEQLQKNKIELLSSDDLEKKIMHGTQVNMKCRSGFISPIQSTQMNGECNNGIMKYPKCVSNPFCRLKQEKLDEYFLELDAKHENVVYYGEGETVTFRCKQGYSITSGLIGICSNGEMTFPVCKKKDVCYINQEMLDENNLEVHRNQQHLKYFENAEKIEFTCRSGFVKKYKSTNMNRKCNKGTINYPRGVCKKEFER